MTEAQIKWAAQHDWFIRAWGLSHKPMRFVAQVADRATPDNKLTFTDYAQLRAWAGY